MYGNVIISKYQLKLIRTAFFHVQELKNESCFVHQHNSVCLPAGIFHDPSFSGAVTIIYYTLNQVLLLEACALGITYTIDNDSLTPCDRLPIQSVIVSSSIGRSRHQTLNASVKIVLHNRYVRIYNSIFSHQWGIFSTITKNSSNKQYSNSRYWTWTIAWNVGDIIKKRLKSFV